MKCFSKSTLGVGRLACGIFLVLLMGCSTDPPNWVESSRSQYDIDRVYMHRPGNFSVSYIDPKDHQTMVFDEIGYVPVKVDPHIEHNYVECVIFADSTKRFDFNPKECTIYIQRDIIEGGEYSTGGKYPQHYQTIPLN